MNRIVASTVPRIIISHDDETFDHRYRLETEEEEDEEDEATARRNRILQRRQLAIQRNTLRFD